MKILTLSMLLLCGWVLSAANDLKTLYLTEWRSSNDGWRLTHFRGDVTLQERAAIDGVTLSAPSAGTTLDSWYLGIMRPREAKVVIEAELVAHVPNLPLLLCVSSGPGCGSPAIKQKVLLPEGELTKVAFTYDIAAFPSPFVIEFVIEGEVPAGNLLTLKSLKMTEAPPDPFQWHLEPGSGVVFLNHDEIQPELSGFWTRDEFGPLEVKLENAQGVAVKEVISEGTKGQFTLQLHNLPVGDYTLIAQPGGLEPRRQTIRIRKVKESSFTIADRVPYYGDEPFFAIGIFHAGDRVINLINEGNAQMGIEPITRGELFGELQKRNFNVVHSSWINPTNEYCQEAANYGFLVLSESRNDLAGIQRLSAEPNLLGFYSWDEPKGSDMAACAALYRQYKEIMPDHPVMIAFDSQPSGTPPEPLVDIAMLDPYPIESRTSDISSTITFQKGAREHLFRNDSATCEYAVTQVFTMDNGRFSSEPTPEQMQAEVFAALIGGAKGIFYYGLYTHEPLERGMERNSKRKHWYLPESRLWDSIGELNAKIAENASFFLHGETPEGVQLDGDALSRAWEWRGNGVILAVNPTGSGRRNFQWRLPNGDRGSAVLAPYETMMIHF